MADLNPVDAMTADYRAMCAELVRRWDTAPCWPSPSQRHDLLDIADAMDRARAALAQPKPPSLKEQALAALDDAIMRGDCITTSDARPTLRRALEALDD